MTNPQHRNVGNTGDILKHAALLELVSIFKGASGGDAPIYLDTHAFQFSAAAANPEQWCTEATNLSALLPAYGRYLAAHRGLPSGDVLCSTGLVATALEAARLVLFEVESQTRMRLLSALHARGRDPEFVGADMMDDRLQPSTEQPGPLLVLVDPFFQTEAEYMAIWDQACRLVERLHRPGTPCVLEAYQWRRQGDRPRWPQAPRGLVGPIATISAEKHHLAVYSTTPEILAGDDRQEPRRSDRGQRDRGVTRGRRPEGRRRRLRATRCPDRSAWICR